ncbi:U7 snRNA-associated Sm-like protein LSm11 [Zootermopsis nevadensis]|uniref:U7 snRNA-associated Sm-like protein LSm11 n=1 Tax=Zootermopsis nevadensis TaxID=136037 RepID=UPI000B8E8F0D|nr:U7 snRNA-associated Sm-like protein LSm11 [Zootermopsis nevadensis]
MGDKSEEEEESLDFTSPKFDPLKALYSKNVRLPIPNAPVLDNIHKYRSSLNPREKKRSEKVDKDNEPGPSSEEQPERRFLPHQVPIPNVRPHRDTRNVLSRMKNMTGPLSVLWECMERRVRIKVFTRNMVFFYCVAFLAAFDKHWNLALEDVREVWTRRKRNKVPALGEPSAVNKKELQPRVVVLRTDRKNEVCERHVNQLLLRGEHVALISVLDS